MQNKLSLISPLPPSVNRYLNYNIRRRGNRMYVEVFPSHETKAYNAYFEDYVRDEIENQGWIIPEKDKLVYVEITYYLDRKRKDPNNFLKVPIDVLTKAGVVLDDDVVLPVSKRVYIDKENPRLEIEIYEAESIGIFENDEHLKSFKENNCFKCSKDENKCSFLKKSLENRIIPEIIDDKCHKIKLNRFNNK